MLSYEINLGPIPQNCASLRSDDSEVKSFYLNATADDLIEHFVEDHKIRGIADFQNNLSSAKHLIRMRVDKEEIMSRVRQLGKSKTKKTDGTD